MTRRHKPRHYKPDAERKSKPISLRVTAEVHDLITRAADGAEVTVTTYVTQAAVKQAKKDLS